MMDVVAFILFLASSVVGIESLNQESDQDYDYDDSHRPAPAQSKTQTLYIGGIFPMTGGWAGGKGCRPAVDMALEDVNNRADILPGYVLEMVANDSQVSGTTSFLPGLHYR